ncbi:PREDICTED: 3-keto-steroid reductase-like [Branchiostoma belcheri]|uniref:3-keto-steroid reductase/17-beta-hydroxysteroid dehydrogenase 7 n=1 Tax=Branchiostoma belcheri TaxID=7741 RepID=A0A6P4YF98_BRABE|nr:PREDICTED: 3-keto-steroid reductase-like [Branchiostoma belcheri]
MAAPNGKVAVITGGNAGIGLTLAERLLTLDPTLTLCLACRNMMKAEAARQALLTSHPGSRVECVRLDTSDVQSVYTAAQKIREEYPRVNYLYLNAGTMGKVSVDAAAILKALVSPRAPEIFRTGEKLLSQKDETTKDGLQEIFATNVFGHFVLIRELEDVLCQADHTSQVIWTSSQNATRKAFDLEDFQHSQGHEGYSSSKYVTDVLSAALNERYRGRGLFSHTACPGLVVTNLTKGILPFWLWWLMLPLLWLMRALVPSMTISPHNGTEVLVWLSQQVPSSLDPLCKYTSRCKVWGTAYVDREKLDIDLPTAEQFYQKLLQLENHFREKYREVRSKIRGQ